jgi:hypothetical protein
MDKIPSKFDGNLICFFFPHKTSSPVHIAHIDQIPTSQRRKQSFVKEHNLLNICLKFILHLQKNKLGVPNFKAEIIPFIPDQDNACVGK